VPQTRLPRRLVKEKQVLQNLSQQQVEAALRFLSSPLNLPPPKELQELNSLEWFLLSRMLEQLLEEKEQSPVQ
jgi:hypothetical protein